MVEPKKNRILVAGATGYLGQYVVRELLARGLRVRILCRDAGRARRLFATQAPQQLEIVEATVTGTGEGLHAAMENVSCVFSALGITRQRDGLRYMDVDYQANRNLLDAAVAGAVPAFVYTASLGAEQMRGVALIEAKEKFVQELLECPGIRAVVLRPSGFFSDLREFLEMVRRSGRIFIFGGRDEITMNPIHGADLAVVCADACLAAIAGNHKATISVGGPGVFSHDQIARLAFEALGVQPVRIHHLPVWCARLIAQFARWCLPQSVGGPLDFLLHALSTAAVAPATGTHRLSDFFNEQAEQKT